MASPLPQGGLRQAHTRLGYAKMEMGDAAGAIPSLERALQLNLKRTGAATPEARALRLVLVLSWCKRKYPAGMPGASGAPGGMPDLSALAK